MARFVSGLAVTLVGAVGLLGSCTDDGAGFPVDPSAPSQSGTVGTCNPVISDLKFAKGEWAKLGNYIRVTFTYKLKCYADISGATVYVKVSNEDATSTGKPLDQEYQFGAADSTYVDYSSASKELWVDFSIGDDDTTTTFGFIVKLKDDQGYWSNELADDDVVYVDIDREVDSDDTPSPTPEE